MADHHVAQFNVARVRAPLDDPIMASFVERLAELNQLADRSPGFVWRHAEDASDDSTSVRPYDDQRVIINFSMWETIDALHTYAYKGAHGPVYAARAQWFEPMDEATLVLWWVPAGDTPTVPEAMSRLELLQQRGPTPQAFTFKQRFGPPQVDCEGGAGV